MKKTIVPTFFCLFCFLLTGISVGISAETEHNSGKPGYAIVVSETTGSRADWAQVVSALKQKWDDQYQVQTFYWKSDLTETLESLQSFRPRYICFVARPEESVRAFVVTVHQMTRQIDDDPYTDAIWGILTGFEAQDAERIVGAPALTVSRAAGGTSIPLELFESGIWYDEGVQGHFVEKKPGQKPQERNDGPADTTCALVQAIDSAQLVVSSGHATERDWQLGYAYRNGYLTCKNGNLFGVTTRRETVPVESKQSKVWLASGNCLIGHVRDLDCMALAMIHSANVDTMVGYTVPTWFGYMGWGILDYYLEQPGRFTAAEAFFANNQALTWNLEQRVPGLSAAINQPPTKPKSDTSEPGSANAEPGSESAKESEPISESLKQRLQEQLKQNGQFLRGLIFDQNVVALYGDPAWQNALAKQESGWEQKLEFDFDRTNGDTVWTLTITPQKGEKSFSVINGNGSERNGRPIFAFLPRRIDVSTIKIESGAALQPTITDDFILVPQTESLKNSSSAVLRFSAKAQDNGAR